MPYVEPIIDELCMCIQYCTCKKLSFYHKSKLVLTSGLAFFLNERSSYLYSYSLYPLHEYSCVWTLYYAYIIVCVCLYIYHKHTRVIMTFDFWVYVWNIIISELQYSITWWIFLLNFFFLHCLYYLICFSAPEKRQRVPSAYNRFIK